MAQLPEGQSDDARGFHQGRGQHDQDDIYTKRLASKEVYVLYEDYRTCPHNMCNNQYWLFSTTTALLLSLVLLGLCALLH